MYRFHLMLSPVVLLILLCVSLCQSCDRDSTEHRQPGVVDTLRIATYNVSMYRQGIDSLRTELQGDIPPQVRNVAAIIQTVRPDILGLMEFDYDPTGQSIVLFRQRCLEVSQHGADTIVYPYAYQAPSNTGMISGVDLDGDGEIKLPEDAFGFGRHPGQYAFALLSKYPIHEAGIRTFRQFLWKDMPDPKWPVQADGVHFYSEEAREVFRISSKNHIDIPVLISNDTVHIILGHPTPPVFDGTEDRNGLRNFDEIRLIRDYVENAEYLVDDQDRDGGLEPGSSFVIMGDLNADPYQGDSAPGAIAQLLNSQLVHQEVAYGRYIPSSAGAAAMPGRDGFDGVQAHNTSMFGMRIDYVLPSHDLEVTGSGVFWPASDMPGDVWVRDRAASDHLLVWVDIKP